MAYWKGKTALITGGSDGLGLSIAQALVERDANVAIVGRNAEKLETAARGLRSRGEDRVTAINADVTREQDVQRMLDATLDRFKRLDMLVNAAGSSARGDVLTTPLEDFRRLMEVNFFATVASTQAALPHLRNSGGHVVNIGSLASKTASRYMGGYAASKFAVAAFSQQLRLEMAEEGLHVLLVCPGPIARREERVYPGSENLPEQARKPGAGAKLRLIDPGWLANRILQACERREIELVVPGKARLLFALAQLSPRWGDWLLRRMT